MTHWRTSTSVLCVAGKRLISPALGYRDPMEIWKLNSEKMILTIEMTLMVMVKMHKRGRCLSQGTGGSSCKQNQWKQ